MGNERRGQAAGKIGNDACALVAQPVDQGPAKKARQDDRQDRKKSGDARLCRAAGGLQHEPGDGNQRKDIANQRDRIGYEEGIEGDRVMWLGYC